MDTDQLIAKGLRLARPSLVLRAGGRGGRPAGSWGGAGVVPPPAGGWRHWLMVECGWLHDQGLPLRGCLSLYEAEGDALQFVALADEGKGLSEASPGGTPLFGEEELSIPTTGSTSGGGGWHALWPDMDAYDEEKGRLVLWTFHDAEPWVEVWLDEGGRLRAVPRTT